MADSEIHQESLDFTVSINDTYDRLWDQTKECYDLSGIDFIYLEFDRSTQRSLVWNSIYRTVNRE